MEMMVTPRPPFSQSIWSSGSGIGADKDIRGYMGYPELLKTYLQCGDKIDTTTK